MKRDPLGYWRGKPIDSSLSKNQLLDIIEELQYEKKSKEMAQSSMRKSQLCVPDLRA